MAVHLDPFIVSSRNKVAAAGLLGDLPGVPWAATGMGPFSPVCIHGGLTLDFFETSEDFPVEHFCFHVDPQTFDAVLGCLKSAGIPYRSTVRGPVDMQVGGEFGNVYWNEPDGHQWEMLTVGYARRPG